jgi:transposase-like protein
MIEAQQVENWVDQARERLDITRERATEWDEKIRTFTRERPLSALLLAVSGGYMLARVFSMRFR